MEAFPSRGKYEYHPSSSSRYRLHWFSSFLFRWSRRLKVLYQHEIKRFDCHRCGELSQCIRYWVLFSRNTFNFYGIEYLHGFLHFVHISLHVFAFNLIDSIYLVHHELRVTLYSETFCPQALRHFYSGTNRFVFRLIIRRLKIKSQYIGNFVYLWARQYDLGTTLLSVRWVIYMQNPC